MHDGLLTRGVSFADDLAKLRNQKNLTEEELAESAGCTWQDIRRYESGKQKPQDSTVQMFNHILVGRDRWGMQIGHMPQDERQSDVTSVPNDQLVADLTSVPDDQLVAELQRRLSSVKSQ